MAFLSRLNRFRYLLINVNCTRSVQTQIRHFHKVSCLKPTYSPIDFRCAYGFHISRAINGQHVQFKLSDIGEGIQEVVIKEWHVKVGDRVAQFDSVCEVQSDKAAVTITSRYDGVIKRIYYDVDAVAFVGKPLVDIELDGDHEVEGAFMDDASGSTLSIDDPDSSSSDEENLSSRDVKVLATPSVRRIASEHKINLRDVTGSGKEGRVLKEDILRHLDQGSFAVVPPSDTSPSSIPSPAVIPGPPVQVTKEDRKVPLKGIMKAMKNAMAIANQIPHFSYCDEIDLTNLVLFRQQAKTLFSGSDAPKISYMPFMIKAASLALKEYPGLNAHTDEMCDHIIYKASHNIGIAMDTADGLLVPSVKDVQHLSVLEIAEELKRLMELGRVGKLGQKELSGSTFTLSNIGNIGGTYTKPVILAPAVMIGGIGKVQKLPRFDDEERIRAAHIMNISWCADHRVVDGATVARFSNLWKQYLEHPQSMLLSLK